MDKSDAIFPLNRIRNIGIVAHIDAGKTTLTERILYYTGRVHRIGEVDEGSATMDWMDQEKERGITITSAATYCMWKGYKINIIDTPGHVDFTVEVERSLRVLDGGVIIFSAVEGVEPQSETVWRQGDKYGVPRITFINKMDRVGADFFRTVEMMEKKFSIIPLILQLPIGTENEFRGIVDIMKMKGYIWDTETLGATYKEIEIPDELKQTSLKYREKMLEIISEHNEGVAEKFVTDVEISEEEIKDNIRDLTLKNVITPVYCGSAFKNKGVQKVLDAIIDYLPSPLEVPPVKGTNPDTDKEEERSADVGEPFSALVFKIVSDPHGRLSFARIYSGTVSTGKTLLNVSAGKRERVSRIIQMHANKRAEIKEAHAGEIAAFVGFRSTKTGDTLTDQKHPLLFEPPTFPEPVISISIESKTREDQSKLAYALERMLDEDPTFRVRQDKETGQTLISGMGELHLEIIVERMRREYGVKVKTGYPRVAYRETITDIAESEGRFVKQSGGKGMFGDVKLRIEPSKNRFEFIDKTKGGVIPVEFIPAVQEGVEEAMETGILAGYPVINLDVYLIDGSYHPVDSSALAFKIAGSIAFKNAYQKANPVLLEPVMRIEVLVPLEHLGNVIEDLRMRRAKIQSIEQNKEEQIILAIGPLSEFFGYTTRLRSLTKGRGVYSMMFDHYEHLTPEYLDKLLKKLRGY